MPSSRLRCNMKCQWNVSGAVAKQTKHKTKKCTVSVSKIQFIQKRQFLVVSIKTLRMKSKRESAPPMQMGEDVNGNSIGTKKRDSNSHKKCKNKKGSKNTLILLIFTQCHLVRCTVTNWKQNKCPKANSRKKKTFHFDVGQRNSLNYWWSDWDRNWFHFWIKQRSLRSNTKH